MCVREEENDQQNTWHEKLFNKREQLGKVSKRQQAGEANLGGQWRIEKGGNMAIITRSGYQPSI